MFLVWKNVFSGYDTKPNQKNLEMSGGVLDAASNELQHFTTCARVIAIIKICIYIYYKIQLNLHTVVFRDHLTKL